jgi:hypothetical protein
LKIKRHVNVHQHIVFGWAIGDRGVEANGFSRDDVGNAFVPRPAANQPFFFKRNVVSVVVLAQRVVGVPFLKDQMVPTWDRQTTMKTTQRETRFRAERHYGFFGKSIVVVEGAFRVAQGSELDLTQFRGYQFWCVVPLGVAVGVC